MAYTSSQLLIAPEQLRPDTSSWRFRAEQRVGVQEVLERVCEPQLLLPSQFFDKKIIHSGERRLLLAILTDAINCYLYGNRTDSRQAAYWFTNFYQNQKTSFMSFYFICEIFNIDPQRLWGDLGNLKSRGLSLTRSQPERRRYFKGWRKATG